MNVGEILSQAGESESDALKEHATLVALSKISRYEAECGHFSAKYAQSLGSFRERIQKTEGEEDFEMENDFMDWEYAESALNWWRSRIEELHNAG